MDIFCRTWLNSSPAAAVIICGDWNIAHREADLTNWKSNKNSGFLPEERAWLTRLFDEVGWVDVYHPAPGPTDACYTLVVQPGQAWARTSAGGWTARLPRPAPHWLPRQHRSGDERFSDHAPLSVGATSNLDLRPANAPSDGRSSERSGG